MRKNLSLFKRLLALSLSASILACSHLIPQKKTDKQDAIPAPECKKNYSREVNLLSGSIYKTSVKYDNLDSNKAFDAALFSLQNQGHSIVFTDRGSGTIHGQRVLRDDQRTSDSIEVNIAKEKTSLIVRVSLRATGEPGSPERLCGFYEEFDKVVNYVPPAPTTAQPPKPIPKPASPPSIKVQETEKPVAPAVESKPKPAPTPVPPSASQPYRVTEVVWPSVNLREGPGTNYKITGNARKGTSLQVLEDQGSWLRVRLADGRELWVSKLATSETPTPASTPSPNPSSARTPSPSPPPSPPPSKQVPSKPLSPM